MSGFIVRLEAEEGVLVFQFDRLYTIKGVIYFVTVTGRTYPHYFHMERRNGHWAIAAKPEAASWVYAYEDILAERITRNEEEV